MANAARELAEILLSWRVVARGQTVYSTRGTNDPQSLDFWRAQIHAVDLLEEVSSVLRAARASGSPKEHYERAEPSWCRAVFGPDLQWNQPPNSAVSVVEPSSIDILYGLADWIDATAFPVPTSGPHRVAVGGALDEIVALLDGLDLGPAEKRYVFELIMSVRSVLSESEAFGTVDLAARLHELFGFLTHLADDLESDPKTKSVGKKLKQAARKVLPYARFGTGLALGAIGAAADVQQLAGPLLPGPAAS